MIVGVGKSGSRLTTSIWLNGETFQKVDDLLKGFRRHHSLISLMQVVAFVLLIHLIPNFHHDLFK
jgi:hypothetical protein